MSTNARKGVSAALEDANVPVEYVDAQELWDEKERARQADEEALRSGRKTPEQLKRENEIFALPPDRIRINLDSARSLS